MKADARTSTSTTVTTDVRNIYINVKGSGNASLLSFTVSIKVYPCVLTAPSSPVLDMTAFINEEKKQSIGLFTFTHS
jgi:hypothetical protein